MKKHDRPVPTAPRHRRDWSRWGRYCTCGLRWPCPDRLAGVPLGNRHRPGCRRTAPTCGTAHRRLLGGRGGPGHPGPGPPGERPPPVTPPTEDTRRGLPATAVPPPPDDTRRERPATAVTPPTDSARRGRPAAVRTDGSGRHVAARPAWRCRACAAPWPCQPAELSLRREYAHDPAGAGHLPLPAHARRDHRCAAGRHRHGRPGRLFHPLPRLDPPRPAATQPATRPALQATTRPTALPAIRVVALIRARRRGLIDTTGPMCGCPRRSDTPTSAPLS
ncbi:hypothetical protein GA0070216_106237 [Micromonospora matsumotoense]|uniref:Uncharacterized protein n=1 Tax=Micromonospora matsumotoense TaxID=121616 RepID=A0A1C4YJ98_9ACTN|nr:hypothetical protein GA0070216_106237 [Micromonospora matsumotoense]